MAAHINFSVNMTLGVVSWYTVTHLIFCIQRTSNRRYRFEYEEQDHIELLEIVKTLPFSVMLSGYPSTLYEDLLTGWRILELQVIKPVHINIDQTPVSRKLAEIKPVSIYQVRRTEKEILCNRLIEQFYYLNYCQPVGEHLKYIVLANDRPIACFTWSFAPRHIGCRDKYIGWNANERKSNIHLIAYNSRFLILPWVIVKFLASYLPGQMAKRISDDWCTLYNNPIYFLETFVDTEKLRNFQGFPIRPLIGNI